MDPRLAQRLAEKKDELDRYRPLSSATVAYINEQLRVLLTYHSNAIEGNTLSLRETQLVIEHGITIGGHSLREHLEATNHAQAFAYLIELIEKRTLITRDVILTLNRLVVDKLIDAPGEFRSGPITIRGARMQPPHASQVPRLMEEWITWITQCATLSGDQPVTRSSRSSGGRPACRLRNTTTVWAKILRIRRC
jgi:Fic family protein